MRTNTAINTLRLLTLRTIVAAIALLVLCCSQVSLAQQSQPRTFASASTACRALYQAAKNNDGPAIQAILGVGPELTSTGNPTEDKLNRERFVQKYQEMHRLVQEPNGTTTLYIGAENWPFPFPLVSKGGKWHFDSDAGARAILARQIGRNEITAIDVCEAFATIRGPHVNRTADQDATEKFASALANNTNVKSGNIESFRGYQFKLATGKPADLLLVAYPAEYRSSGVMTFIVTPDGSVYQKDLGPQTSSLAKQVQARSTEDWVAVQLDPVP